jgi:hypothetical protein
VRGLLYHDASMVFGEALVRAYELESTIARIPHVIIGKEVMGDIESIATARALLNVAPPAADPQKQPDVAPDSPHVLPCPCPAVALA